MADAIASRILMTAVAAMLAAGPATAAVRGGRTHVELKAQKLDDALRSFAHQTGQQILFAPATVRGKWIVAIDVDDAPEAALTLILRGTGLSYTRTASGALVVTASQGNTMRTEPALIPASVQMIGDGAPPPGDPVKSAEAAAAPASDIIVTGTRAANVRAADSAAPIKVIDAETLSHVGQPNINQALAQLVPSFTAEAFGGDTANLTLSARLRGLSPNQVLVLVNGKRRHGTANLHVLGGPFQGGAAPDLDLIPPASIARIEVLEDGAAAQYGSDAIAGVINIILKKDASGGTASATAGQYYKGDGTTYAATANLGVPLGEGGFLNLTLFHRFHDYSDRNGPDSRVANRDGSLRTDLTPAQRTAYAALPGFPNVNHITGDARSRLSTIFYNAGYDFGAVQFYSFGGYGRRTARAFENFRLPDRIVASAVPGVPGDLGTPGAIVYAPQGFNPKEGLTEDDYSVTAGIKSTLAGWSTDLSTTYGRDRNTIYTYDSANASLFIDTGRTPNTFYDGSYINTEWTTNLDLVRDLDLGMAGPLTLAVGAEYRRNIYELRRGDAASTYKEGAQAFPGLLASDSGRHSRDNVAGYLDVALTPVAGMKLDLAGRYEHYTDFGDTLTGKATARYDISRAFALRGTVSTGFRAPTLAEEFYSATTVSTTDATVQLPPNSPATRLLGFDRLKAEKSTNFSAGAVFRPAPRATLTIDAYQVRIRNRIVATGTIYGSGGAINSQAVIDAIRANGNTLDPTVTYTAVSLFTNGIDTRTRGVDAVASTTNDLGALGKVTWSIAANLNKTNVTRVAGTPAPVAPQPLFSPTTISQLEKGSPSAKVILGAFWKVGPLGVTLRETVFGKTSVLYSPDGSEYTVNPVNTAGITDLEVNFRATKRLELTLGANNLFDKRPQAERLNSTGAISSGNAPYDAPNLNSPYGINGGYYYARAAVTF